MVCLRVRRITIQEFFRKSPIHPFFLATYPIVSLLAFNISQIYTNDALKPILIALFSTAIILVVLRVISRDWQVAGLLTSMLAIWFFVYGHLYNQLKGLSLMGINIGRHRYLLVVWTAIILAVTIWLVKKIRTNHNLTLGLNIASAILLSLSIIQVGAFHLRNLFYPQTPTTASEDALISWTNQSSLPDIYFIILDGYARSDALAQVEGIDNTAFLDSLRQLGFYVAGCSQSNYTRTLLSLTSTFNMEYLQALNPQLKPDQDTSWLVPYLKHSIVRQQLEQLGYKTIVFQDPWEAWIWDDAAIVFRPTGSGVLSNFEYLLLSTTVTRVYLDEREAESTKIAYYTNYVDTLYTLDQLQTVPSISGPKFVFVHLMIPHAPFVFGPDGEYIDIQPYDTVKNLYTAEDHKRGYTAAVAYINKRMLEIIPKLIRESNTPPVIILAGDHGTGYSNTVTQNLEAFFTPESQVTFYPDISPVNIFRLLFASYFNGNFGLLPDRSYFSAEGQYFNFKEIPDECEEH